VSSVDSYAWPHEDWIKRYSSTPHGRIRSTIYVTPHVVCRWSLGTDDQMMRCCRGRDALRSSTGKDDGFPPFVAWTELSLMCRRMWHGMPARRRRDAVRCHGRADTHQPVTGRGLIMPCLNCCWILPFSSSLEYPFSSVHSMPGLAWGLSFLSEDLA
jgi:hypothetical protein